MKQRSPVLGYNHNVRYAGRLWHVQTEDSGANNPHVFTHLFHDGTILATKRLDYDPASDVPAVQKLMQAQHKAMLRELKAGSFDEKIGKFFGEPVLKHVEDETTDPHAQPPIAADVTPVSSMPPVHEEPRTNPHLSSPTRSRIQTPPPPVQRSTPTQAPTRARVPTPAPAAPRGVPSISGGIGGRRPSSTITSTNRPTAEGVVVARPAVIIGGDSRSVTGTFERKPAPSTSPRVQQQASVPPKTEERRPSTNENIFGGDLISEKSLDEVILAYLSEDLNEK
jgi:hypothetical protein